MKKIGLILSIAGVVNAASYEKFINGDDHTRLISKKTETTAEAATKIFNDQVTPTTLSQAKRQISAFCDAMNAKILAISTAGEAIAKCKTETDDYRCETYNFKFKSSKKYVQNI